MPEKNLADVIQDILDKNKGFVNIKNLPSLLGSDLRFELGLKNGLTGPVIRKKIEPLVENRFMFHKRGNVLYIMTPCEPAELVISAIKSSKSATPKMVVKSLPFSKKEFLDILNSLFEEGRAKLVLNENLDVKLILIDKPKAAVTTSKAPEVTPSVQPDEKGEQRDYSPRKFREAFYALDKGRIFVNIYELRRELNWPREVFDEMLRKLRDEDIIQLHVGDSSTITPDEVNDCFVDENNYRMGTVTWNDGK